MRSKRTLVRESVCLFCQVNHEDAGEWGSAWSSRAIFFSVFNFPDSLSAAQKPRIPKGRKGLLNTYAFLSLIQERYDANRAQRKDW